MPTYRRKVGTVEAVQFVKAVGSAVAIGSDPKPDWLIAAERRARGEIGSIWGSGGDNAMIATLDSGHLSVKPGDWIVRFNDELFAISDSEFKQNYEPVGVAGIMPQGFTSGLNFQDEQNEAGVDIKATVPPPTSPPPQQENVNFQDEQDEAGSPTKFAPGGGATKKKQ